MARYQRPPVPEPSDADNYDPECIRKEERRIARQRAAAGIPFGLVTETGETGAFYASRVPPGGPLDKVIRMSRGII